MQQDIVKRLVWSGLLTAFGALASLAAAKMAATAYRRIYREEPPK